MKILMINPPIYDFSAYDLWMKPLGFLKIGDLLIKNGVKVFYFDFLDRKHPFYEKKKLKNRKFGTGNFYSVEIEKPSIYKDVPRKYKRFGLPLDTFDEFIKEIEKPDFIFISSGMTYWYPGVQEVVKQCRKYFPDVSIIVGGIYATFCYYHAEKYLDVEMVFKGKSIVNFISEFNKKFSKDLKFFEKLYPYWDFYKNLDYFCLKTSCGCPFSCYYCGIKLLEPYFYQEKPEDIFKHLKINYEKFKFENVAFYDDALLYNFEKHLLKFLNLVKKDNMKLNFHTPNGLHPRFITRKVAAVFREMNFKTIRLSLETVSPERKHESDFKVSFSDFEKAIKYLQEAGYSREEVGVYILAGLPGQSYEEVWEIVKLLKNYPCKINIAEYSPIPGTIDFKISKELYPCLPLDEPLFQNNSIFPLWNFPDKWQKIEELKNFAHSNGIPGN